MILEHTKIVQKQMVWMAHLLLLAAQCSMWAQYSNYSYTWIYSFPNGWFGTTERVRFCSRVRNAGCVAYLKWLLRWLQFPFVKHSVMYGHMFLAIWTVGKASVTSFYRTRERFLAWNRKCSSYISTRKENCAVYLVCIVLSWYLQGGP